MGLYWNTLRKNHANFIVEDESRQGKGKIFKNHLWTRGAEACVVLTTNCNLRCSYCPMWIEGNKPPYTRNFNTPKFPVCTLDEWKQYFKTFPEWIAQMYLSGGETSLVPYISDLVNWLVKRNHHITLFSNLLKPESFFNIKKAVNFILMPTYHKFDNLERYKKALELLKKNCDFRIVTQEIKDSKMDGQVKAEFPEHFFTDTDRMFHIPPDAPRTGALYLGAKSLYEKGRR